ARPSRRERASSRECPSADGPWPTTLDVAKPPSPSRSPHPRAPRRPTLALAVLPLAVALAGWGLYRHASGSGRAAVGAAPQAAVAPVKAVAHTAAPEPGMAAPAR